MIGFLGAPGFLGTNATFRTDATLLGVLGTAILFIAGWRLSVRKEYRNHCRLQAWTTVLNLLFVLGGMAGPFRNVISIIPASPMTGFFALTISHAIVGILSILLGVFVVLSAYNCVPKKFRFKNYKLWMQFSLGLYMLSAILGAVVYYVAYIYIA